MQDLTTGSIPRHLFKTASYMLVTMVFQTLYVLVDLYWVGRLGKEAIAAVSISGNLLFVVLAATQMLGVGATTMVAHAAGQRDHPRALRVFNQALGLATVTGFAFAAIVLMARTPYARGFSADAETARITEEYLLWFVPAMALQFPMIVMAAALRGTGNFKPGMVVQTSTIVLNIIFAPILIFGWGTGIAMGASGAAAATLLAIAFGTVWLSLYFTVKDAYLRFVRADWTPDFSLWRRMLSIGLPAGAEFGLIAAYLAVVYTVSRPFGAAAQAGFGIGLRIIQALFMPAVALGFAVAPLAGQNFGARHPERVYQTFKTGLALAVSVMAVFAVACYLAPGWMIRVFSSDPEVVAVGEEYLRITSWNFVASGVVFVSGSMFQGIGNTMPSLIASCMRIVVVAIPAFLLARMPGFELRWIWYLTVVSVLLQMTLALFLLRRELRIRLDFPAVPTKAAQAAAAP